MARRRTQPEAPELTNAQERYLRWRLTFLCYGLPSECAAWQTHPFESDAEVFAAYRQHRDEIPEDHPLHELAA